MAPLIFIIVLSVLDVMRINIIIILIGNAARVVLPSTNQDDQYLQVGWSHHPGGHDRS